MNIVEEFLILTFAEYGAGCSLASYECYEDLRQKIKFKKPKSEYNSLLQTLFDVDLNIIGDPFEIPYELRLEASERITSGWVPKQIRKLKL